ncbi:MAG: Xaa-Pro peptidase family protein [Anaerolineae bacterium]
MTEFDKRIEGLRANMQEAGVDLVAIGPTANMRYLAGFAPHPDERPCLLLISPQAVQAVVPKLNAEEWSAHVDLPLHAWADHEGPEDALKAALSGIGRVRKLAVDGAMRADFLLPLQAATQPEVSIPAEALIAPLRACKSADEIEALARAAAQADRAMQAAVDACIAGVSETQVAWAAEEAFRLDGAEEVCFTLVASGPNGAYPHHHSGGRLLGKGDAIILDIGASLDGYKSDITRMVFLGEPPAEFLEAYQAVLEANTAGRAAVAPGVLAQEVDRVTRSTLEARGLGEYFIHRTGHGLGLEVHEAPYIMAGNGQPLEKGMTFSVEPGVYFPGKFGIRIEDIVAVTEEGARTLTGFDRQLVVKD